MPAIPPSEIGQWFETEAAALVLYARRWFGQAEAEEVVQEAFMKLVQQRRRPDHVRGWLYTTVRNGAISRIRSSSRRRVREEKVSKEDPDCFEGHPGDRLDAQAAQKALADLPEEEREIVTLRIWGGMTLKEIGAMCGYSIPTVFRHYRAALGRLREAMQNP
jgi:RNA polymerase sigma-70 factor (ECF subfamily)